MSLTFTDPLYLWALLLIPAAWGLAALAPRGLPVARRRLSLALRTLVLALLVLALAGAQMRHPVNDLTVVFLVDVSDSMPGGARALTAEFIRAAIAEMPAGDRAAVVLFGKEALVERTASDFRQLDPLSSVPIATRTDVAGAIQLGLALLPGDMQKRLVLLSDGQENLGDARQAAALADARGVVLDVVVLGGPGGGPEVQVSALEAPHSVRQGQRFEVAVRLQANQPSTVRLRLFGDGTLLYDEAVEVPNGGTTYHIPLEADEAGFRRYRAVIETAGDTRRENNEAAAFTEVEGPPRVALITGAPDEALPLLAALEAAQMQVELLAPAAAPQTLPDMAQYDSIVLLGVEAPELPAATMTLLPTFVHDLGHGLVMVGGPTGFGAGQWLRTPVEEALPVDMEVRPKDNLSNVALVLAVDKSGSMGRCHCDDPSNAAQQQQRPESGLPKVDIAKDAVIQATAALSQFDFVGVVAFDNAARWALETQPYPGLGTIEQAIAPIDANGSTNLFAGLQAAGESLDGVPARIKHVILLTDGWSRAGDYQRLAEEFKAAGITLSVVAAGGGSAPDLLLLAEASGGAFYPAASMEDVPQIFLKETIRIAGRYIIEEPFYPTLKLPNSTILSGLSLDAVPPLVGYNGSTLKGDATEVLRTPQGDPLLATRRYGLGRTVAWTSDLSARWAGDWLGWESFPTFAAQLVGWSFPDPQSGDLRVESRQEGGDTLVAVTALDEEGRPISANTDATIIAPTLESSEVTLQEVGAGQYEATLPSDAVGAYFVTVTQRDSSGALTASTARGVVVPYSPEYRLQAVDERLLEDVAAATGGEVRALSEPQRVFEHPPQYVTRALDLWPWLLGLALLLFPFDVAVRRVVVGRRDWERARRWAAQRRPGATPPTPAAPVLGTLFEAKQRATRRDSAATPTPGAAPPTTPAAPPPTARPAPAPPAPPREEPSDDQGGHEGDDDTFARLRQAKRRTRR